MEAAHLDRSTPSVVLEASSLPGSPAHVCDIHHHCDARTLAMANQMLQKENEQLRAQLLLEQSNAKALREQLLKQVRMNRELRDTFHVMDQGVEQEAGHADPVRNPCVPKALHVPPLEPATAPPTTPSPTTPLISSCSDDVLCGGSRTAGERNTEGALEESLEALTSRMGSVLIAEGEATGKENEAPLASPGKDAFAASVLQATRGDPTGGKLETLARELFECQVRPTPGGVPRDPRLSCTPPLRSCAHPEVFRREGRTSGCTRSLRPTPRGVHFPAPHTSRCAFPCPPHLEVYP